MYNFGEFRYVDETYGYLLISA